MNVASGERRCDALDCANSPKPIGGNLKKSGDMFIALAGLIVLLPLFALCAIGILLTSGGPVFFAHRRVGFNGRSFGCIKFRTMRPNSEALLNAYFAANPSALAEWNATQKLRSDPRVTWFGRLLRKSSLDELPQLLNVLAGQMSVVGPRPVTAQELTRYGRYAAQYVSCRPGITGVWQVSGRSTTTYRRRVACDNYYGRNWSFALDVMVILKTLPALAESGAAC
jgi:exopolysaccharide production protein ExoY